MQLDTQKRLIRRDYIAHHAAPRLLEDLGLPPTEANLFKARAHLRLACVEYFHEMTKPLVHEEGLWGA